MSQYEARLERDLDRIRGRLTDLAGAVRANLETSVKALFSGDHALSYGVCLDDHPINRASRALDKTCHGFIAVHLPSAGHLRFISAVMRANLELERVGDYAVTIARESVQLEQPPAGSIAGHLERVAQEAQRIFGQAVTAFGDGDADAARAAKAVAAEAGRGVTTGIAALVEAEESRAPVRQLFRHLMILNSLRRVFEQSKNICEEAIFAATGETKPPKSYRVLFLDEDNSLLGPLAQAIASRSHPQSGQYDTASRQAAGAFVAGLGAFLEGRGMALQDTSPKALDPATDLDDYHVIVSLQGSVPDYIDAVPFMTIALDWDLSEPAAAGDDATARFEALYPVLASQIQHLMETVHGDEESA